MDCFLCSKNRQAIFGSFGCNLGTHSLPLGVNEPESEYVQQRNATETFESGLKGFACVLQLQLKPK